MSKKSGNEESQKAKRQQYLVDLLSKGYYKTHQEIEKGLAKKAKDEVLDISQSTISRDLKELGISKSDEGVYVVDPLLEERNKKESLAELLKLSNAKSHFPVSFFCVTCDEGYERLVAKKIKDTYSREVVGTLTENSTILVFVSGDNPAFRAQRLKAEIEELLRQ